MTTIEYQCAALELQTYREGDSAEVVFTVIESEKNLAARSEAAEGHIKDLYSVGDLDGSHRVLVRESDGTVQRYTVFVSVQVHAILSSDQDDVVMPEIEEPT